MIEVRYQRGLYLPEAGLWLDPSGSKPCAFVSHAHADHFARHESILCSEVTGSLLQDRYKVAESRLDCAAFHVPVIRNGFRLRLLPAGHIPGSAMLHVTRISDNASLLYTGDFKTRRSRTTEAVNFLAADTLILETTFGLPGYEFPNPMEVEAEVLRFVNDSFADGETPVLLGYSLGKAQEALALLAEHGIPTLLHPTAAAMTRACIRAGVPGLPDPMEFDGHAPPGHALIAPPHAVRTDLLRGLKAKRTAMLSGWALQPGAKFRYRVNAMIPFSDHADHPGLMECIQRVRPKRILTVHGFATEFAAELRSRNMDAWSAAGGDQMELPMQRSAARQPARGLWHKRVLCQLADFSDLCRLISETGSRVAKTRFLTSYLETLEHDGDLQTVVRWLTSADPRGAKHRKLETATLRHALLAIPGVREERFREIHLTHKDLVRSARQLLQEIHLEPDLLDLTGTDAFIRGFEASTLSIARIRSLSSRLATLHPAEGETLLKLLTRNLHLDIEPSLVEEAIITAFQADASTFRNALKITTDLAETAVLARRKILHEAKPASTDPTPAD